MADNINYNPLTQRHSFVSVKERPWHGLGKIVDEVMTASECIQLAGLDYNVIKVPMYADMDYDKVLRKERHSVNEIPDPSMVSGAAIKSRLKANPRSFSTIRTDTRQILGTVGRDYVVIDNKEAFEFFDTIVGTSEAIYETAGALGNGEVIFITAKIPTIIKLGDSIQDDNVERYIVLSNAHDGSRSLEAFVTTIRVVCNNTLAAARSAAKCKFRIRHTKNAKDRINDARGILNLEQKVIDAFALNAKAMTTVNVTDSIATELITNTFLSAPEAKAISDFRENSDNPVHLNRFISTAKINVVNDVFNHYKSGPGSELITAKDTLWGVYNAVSSYYQNGKRYSSKDERMTSLLYGNANKKITTSYGITSDYLSEAIV